MVFLDTLKCRVKNFNAIMYRLIIFIYPYQKDCISKVGVFVKDLI